MSKKDQASQPPEPEESAAKVAAAPTPQPTTTAQAEPVGKALSPKTIITRVTGCSLHEAENLVAKMEIDEVKALAKAYDEKNDPRGVVQRVRDRLADAKAAKQPPS